MHVCIMGTGTSGWMACTILKNLEFITKITIIGSSKIPSIGVGESTTLNFVFHVLKHLDLKEFVQKTDASVKYGVYYQNWSRRDFIHYFKSNQDFLRTNNTEHTWGEMLANKDTDVFIHDLIGNKLFDFIRKNKISLDFDENIHSWHFDAGKFIEYMKELNLKDEKVSFLDDTIVNAELDEDRVRYIVGENNKKYFADYYVNCCGDNRLNQEVFGEEYICMSPYLLTNKALVYPLKYVDKQKQFHPYTAAKTMKNGWRWITPTQSRIGTGYVFSDNHVSVDEATHEFIEDVGDKSIEPTLVDFSPKYNKKPFKINSCTIGMSSGFLEPLDAPGLTISINGILKLTKLLEYKNDKTKLNEYINILNGTNYCTKHEYEWWCSFILHQYKTCWRNDTQFWIDHKNVKCDFYDQIINSLYYVPQHLFERYEYMMFYLTTSAKDIQWKSKVKDKPFPVEQHDSETIHHLDYIQKFYG